MSIQIIGILPPSALPNSGLFPPAQTARSAVRFSCVLSFRFLSLPMHSSWRWKRLKRGWGRERGIWRKEKRKAIKNRDNIFTKLFTANHSAFTREKQLNGISLSLLLLKRGHNSIHKRLFCYSVLTTACLLKVNVPYSQVLSPFTSDAPYC